jgi:hypothetical protein
MHLLAAHSSFAGASVFGLQSVGLVKTLVTLDGSRCDCRQLRNVPRPIVRAFGQLETINRVRAAPIEDLPWTFSLV